MIAAAPQPLKAMILLGINAGLGNADVGRLQERHLNLKTGWLDFPRPKTSVGRRAWLWPETIASIKEAIAVREGEETEAAVRSTVQLLLASPEALQDGTADADPRNHGRAGRPSVDVRGVVRQGVGLMHAILVLAKGVRIN